jgi:hypothetical protein
MMCLCVRVCFYFYFRDVGQMDFFSFLFFSTLYVLRIVLLHLYGLLFRYTLEQTFWTYVHTYLTLVHGL